MVKEVTKAASRPERVKKSNDIATRDYTINFQKALFRTSFKNRAPKAIRVVKAFAAKAMKTR